jgi:5-methylcytosine-specific restriction endonuclease McrA
VDKRKYSDRKDYLIKAVAKRRKEIRLKAIEYAGGKCARCGYNKYPEVLEFHHLNPKEKDFSISEKGYSRSWDKVKLEIEKCLLICANCHRETHVEEKLAKMNNF